MYVLYVRLFLLGDTVYNKVYVTDAVGHTSVSVVSDGITIDVTSADPVSVVFDEENIIINPSFETNPNTPVDLDNLSIERMCPSEAPDDWDLSENGCAIPMSLAHLLASDGQTFILIFGTITQTINVTSGLTYRVRFYTSHLPLESSVLANKEGFVQLGKQKHIFLIYEKSYRRDGDMGSAHESLLWHKHTYYFVPTESEVNLTLGVLDVRRGIAIDDVSLTPLLDVDDETDIDVHVVSMHGWTSVHATWQFEDLQSPITDYSWALGMIQIYVNENVYSTLFLK